MAKKLIIIEDKQTVPAAAVVPQSGFQTTVISTLETIDWKLWEILKIAQRWEETTLGVPPTVTNEPINDLTPHEVDVGMISIIVDEDDDE
jgi:hypothetical protein